MENGVLASLVHGRGRRERQVHVRLFPRIHEIVGRSVCQGLRQLVVRQDIVVDPALHLQDVGDRQLEPAVFGHLSRTGDRDCAEDRDQHERGQ